MGLDMHVYAISRITEEEAKKYNRKPIDEIRDADIAIIRTALLNEDNEKMLETLMPYATNAVVIKTV